MSRDHTVGGAETFTIKEVARRSGLSEHTLRYYEKIGLIRPIPRDDSSGHRRYSAEMAELVELLACLRTSGLTIAEMRARIKLDAGPKEAIKQKALFAERSKEIEKQIKQLRIRKQYLEGKIAYWGAVARGDMQEAERIMDANKNILQQT